MPAWSLHVWRVGAIYRPWVSRLLSSSAACIWLGVLVFLGDSVKTEETASGLKLNDGTTSITNQVVVHPMDCPEGEDCHSVFARAVASCRSNCEIVVVSGNYTIACPAWSTGAYIYSLGPKGAAAIDLSSTRSIVFGGMDGAPLPRISIDYLHGGCPAIAADAAINLTVRNLVLDTVRLPFSQVTVAAAAADGKSVQLKLAEPSRSEWNITKYDWLRWMSFSYTLDRCPSAAAASCKAIGSAGGTPGAYSSSTWDSATGVVTLRWAQSSSARANIPLGLKLLIKHFGNMKSWGVYGVNVRGGLALHNTTLLSAAGMGFRCDFCEGEFAMVDSAIRSATLAHDGVDRKMSTTADAVHLMHHHGLILLDNMTIEGSGDDCFNAHGNFIVLTNASTDRLSTGYIDETGPGWFPQAVTRMIGDTVQFYSRLTLRSLGPPNKIVSVTGGFGYNATVRFEHPIPSEVKRYDMFLSLDRISRVRVVRSSFGSASLPDSGGRGMLTSAQGVEVLNSTFHNLCINNNLLFMGGGCGAYEDYTEGPFARDVTISGNHFYRGLCSSSGLGDLETGAGGGQSLLNGAVVQISACTPTEGDKNAARPAACDGESPKGPDPYRLPPCELGGSTAPPIINHAWTPGSGFGRITEPGVALTGPNSMVHANISIISNVFSQPGRHQRFIDVGVTDGIRISANHMVGSECAGGDVHIYDSNITDTDDNLCLSAIGISRKCSIETTSSRTVAIPFGTVGPIPLGTDFDIGSDDARDLRMVHIVALPTPAIVTALLFYEDCERLRMQSSSSQPDSLEQVEMAIYADQNGSPGNRLGGVAMNWSDCIASGGWRESTLPEPVNVSNLSAVWLAHWYREGAWRTITTQGTHIWRPGAELPVFLSHNLSDWRLFTGSGVPLRFRVQSPAETVLEQ
jgi:hypothetical protein